MNITEFENDTLMYGGEYGLSHSRRIIRLAAIIGENLTFDLEAIQVAAFSHDWGAYPAGSRMEKIPAMLIFEKSRQMAETKIGRMKLLMGLFEEESFGIY